MRDEHGREVVARLADMIPLELAVAVMRGIGRSVEKAGYDAVILTEGPHAGWLAAVPRPKRKRKRAAAAPVDVAPAPSEEQPPGGPAPPEEGAPTAPVT